MAGKNYKIKVALSDGSTKELPFTAPEGPRGPKGDCRGVSVHEVGNTGEFYDLLTGLSDTQKVFAVVANGSVSVPSTTWQSNVQIVRLVQIRGAASIVFQYAFQKEPGASGAAVETLSYTATLQSGGTHKFTMPDSSGSTTTAASLSVYVYDSETPPETVTQAVFPSLAGPFKQAKVPAYASVSAIPTSGTAVASAFNFGAWEPHAVAHNGNFVAFAFIGGRLNAVKGMFDGTDTWSWGEATPLPLGCQVMLQDSQEGHVYIVMLEAQTSATPIYNVVKPLVGMIELEFGPAWGTTYSFGSVGNVHAKIINRTASPTALYIQGISNSFLEFDNSHVPYAASQQLALYCADGNESMDTPVATRSNFSETPVKSYRYVPTIGGTQTQLTLKDNLAPLLIAPDGSSGITQEGHPTSILAFAIQQGETDSLGRQIAYNFKFSITNYHIDVDRYPVFREAK